MRFHWLSNCISNAHNELLMTSGGLNENTHWRAVGGLRESSGVLPATLLGGNDNDSLFISAYPYSNRKWVSAPPPPSVAA